MTSFSWLPLSERKNIVLPTIAVEPNEGQPYGGLYYSDYNHIVVVDYGDEKQMVATLAHEFRHACQRQLNQKACTSSSKSQATLPYELMINSYFNKHEHEMDALLFEYKHAKCELNDWWLNHLVSCKNLSLLDTSY